MLNKKKHFNFSLPIFQGAYRDNNRDAFLAGLSDNKPWSAIKDNLRLNSVEWEEAEIFYSAFRYVVEDRIFCPSMLTRYHQGKDPPKSNILVEDLFWFYLTKRFKKDDLKRQLHLDEHSEHVKTRSAFDNYLEKCSEISAEDRALLQKIYSQAYVDQISLKTCGVVLHVDSKYCIEEIPSHKNVEMPSMPIFNYALAIYAGNHNIADDQREIAQWSMAQEFCTDFQTEMLEKGFKAASESFNTPADIIAKLTTDLTIKTTDGFIDLSSTKTVGSVPDRLTQSGIKTRKD